MNHKVCTSCGYTGRAKNYYPSSLMIDALLTLMALVIGLWTNLLPIVIIPALWTAYHMYKYRGIKCPKCEQLDMMPLRSPEGRLVLSQGAGQPRVWTDADDIAYSKFKRFS